MSNLEQTLSIIKPDAVERNLDNEIKEMFKNKGLKLLVKRKFKLKKMRQKSFIKFMKLNHFTMIYAHIYRLDR